MPHIFLSYSRQDVWIMRFLKNFLSAEGLPLWVDEKLDPGTPDWQFAMQEAIRHAGCMIVILTPEAAESEWVGKEIQYAQLQNKTIFPVLANGGESSAIPLALVRSQWVDIRSNCEVGMNRLAAIIKKHPGVTAARFRPADNLAQTEIRWDRLGSLVWFAIDCQNLVDMIWLTKRVTTADMMRYLTQISHHASRLNYSSGMEITKLLLEKLNRTAPETLDDTDELSRHNYGYIGHWANSLEVALRRLGHQAAEVDPDYDRGPMWE